MKLPVFGKFEIFAVYLKCQQEMLGMPEDEAKRYGFAIAVLGANAKRGVKRKKPLTTDEVVEAAEKKKKKTISEADYDNMMRRRFGSYAKEFESDMRDLVEVGLSYDEVKELVRIPKTWGAKIDWKQWKEYVTPYLLKNPA